MTECCAVSFPPVEFFFVFLWRKLNLAKYLADERTCQITPGMVGNGRRAPVWMSIEHMTAVLADHPEPKLA